MERVAAALRHRSTGAIIAALFALLAITMWASDRPLTALMYLVLAALWVAAEYAERRR